jgi:hypothetical protein
MKAYIRSQREDLEQERRAIATQRYREPIVAAALRSTGLIVACALPLLLAGYALWQMNQKVDESTELGNLLIDELTSPQPILLPPPSRLRLTKSESMPNVDHGNSV